MFLDFLRDERFEASANSASLHVALNTNAQRHDYLNLRYHAPGKPTKRFRMVSSKFLKSVVETWACLLSTATRFLDRPRFILQQLTMFCASSPNAPEESDQSLLIAPF